MVEKPWGRRSKHRTIAVNTTAAVPDNRWPCRGSGNSVACSSPQNDEEVTPVVMIGPPDKRGGACIRVHRRIDEAGGEGIKQMPVGVQIREFTCCGMSSEHEYTVRWTRKEGRRGACPEFLDGLLPVPRRRSLMGGDVWNSSKTVCCRS